MATVLTRRSLGTTMAGRMLRLSLLCSALLLVTASASGAKTEANLLVGTWSRTNSCPALVTALNRAGLTAQVRSTLVGAGYFQRAAQVDPIHPCKGARNLKHSHFFTASGAFGSHDQNGQQVDDGNYKISAPHTLAFPSHTRDFGYKITVRYTIIQGELNFAVVIPKPCAGRCRGATAWAISAFYRGHPFVHSG
jgi:hypothetical protein